MLDAFIDAAAAKIEAAQIVTDDLFCRLKRWVFLSERLNCRNRCRRLIEFIDLMLSEIAYAHLLRRNHFASHLFKRPGQDFK